ncbi:MAG: acyl-CoA dehydrogenase, partial [Alphaproteobacteria bacterium]|nr:acyl-CoA dehydrogenase [Alphaproteobacteria bacterium]
MTAGEAAAGDGEASLLRDAVTKAFRRFDAPSRLVRRDADPQAIAREMWGLASELGLPGLMGPEAQGGQGLGLSEAAIVAEAMGRHSFSGPFMTTAVLARAVASLVDDAAWRERLLPGIAAGATVLSLATTPVLGEPARLEFGAGPAPRLTGSRDVVEHPSLATELLVLDIAGDGDGATITAAVMAARGDGVEAVALQPFDPTCPIARFRFVDAPIRDGLMARRRLDTVALDAFLQPIHVVVAAELLGVASAALDAA